MSSKVDFTYTLDKVFCSLFRPKAILCERDGKEFWVPKSVIHDASEVRFTGDFGNLVVMLWFAESGKWKGTKQHED